MPECMENNSIVIMYYSNQFYQTSKVGKRQFIRHHRHIKDKNLAQISVGFTSLLGVVLQGACQSL